MVSSSSAITMRGRCERGGPELKLVDCRFFHRVGLAKLGGVSPVQTLSKPKLLHRPHGRSPSHALWYLRHTTHASFLPRFIAWAMNVEISTCCSKKRLYCFPALCYLRSPEVVNPEAEAADARSIVKIVRWNALLGIYPFFCSNWHELLWKAVQEDIKREARWVIRARNYTTSPHRSM